MQTQIKRSYKENADESKRNMRSVYVTHKRKKILIEIMDLNLVHDFRGASVFRSRVRNPRFSHKRPLLFLLADVAR